MKKPTPAWLALATLAIVSTIFSMTAGLLRPTSTAGALQPAAIVEATPVQRDVAAEFVDDFNLKPTIGLEALARENIDPNTSTASRAADPAPAQPPPAPAMVATVPVQPWQDSKAGMKPAEANAHPAGKPKDVRAELPGKHAKNVANAKGCAPASSNGIANWWRKLNPSTRCQAKRTAA